MFVRIKSYLKFIISFQKIKLYSPGKPTFPRKTIPLKMKIIFQTCMPLKAQDCNNNCLLDLLKILSGIMGPLEEKTAKYNSVLESQGMPKKGRITYPRSQKKTALLRRWWFSELLGVHEWWVPCDRFAGVPRGHLLQENHSQEWPQGCLEATQWVGGVGVNFNHRFSS